MTTFDSFWMGVTPARPPHSSVALKICHSTPAALLSLESTLIV